jgi:hypothetical protein
MIQLPPRETDQGLEARVLLAECRGPGMPGFDQGMATSCMQLMDLVLWNRVDDPKPFLAKEATLLAVVKARGQFAGFENYPHYSGGIASNIQSIIDIANSPKDPRHSKYSAYVRSALTIVGTEKIDDPSPGNLVAWRTGGTHSPGPDFTLYKTVGGIDFYYQTE